jgi:hypothetical protein
MAFMLKLEDLGKQTVRDSNGRTLEAYVSRIVCASCGEHVGVSQVDVELANITGPGFRAAEDNAFFRLAAQEHRCAG